VRNGGGGTAASLSIRTHYEMPLYEYTCKACGDEFEALVRPNQPAPTCKSCGSAEIEKLLSNVTMSSENTREANLKVARAKAKKVTREKDVAQFEYEEKHRHHH
jgi:putative FmdB family regulatory protein